VFSVVVSPFLFSAQGANVTQLSSSEDSSVVLLEREGKK